MGSVDRGFRQARRPPPPASSYARRSGKDRGRAAAPILFEGAKVGSSFWAARIILSKDGRQPSQCDHLRQVH